MEDILWFAERQSQQLQSFLDEIQGVWSDQRSREIHTRLLNPHRIDTDHMLAEFKGQETALQQAEGQLTSAAIFLSQAQHAADGVKKHLSYTEEEIRKSLYDHETFAKYHRSARLQLPQIFVLIEKANKAGA